MDTAPPAAGVLLWAAPEAVDLCARILERMENRVRVLAAGGPRSAAIEAFARRAGCPVDDDLRKLLNDHLPAFLLLAARQDVPVADVAALLARGGTVLTLEPPWTDVLSVRALAGSLRQGAATAPVGGGIVHLPALQACPGWRAAAHPTEALGTVRALVLLTQADPANGTLIPHVLDAFTTLLSLVGLPESVDASVAGRLSAPPQEPRDLTGSLQIHARLAEGRAAILQVTDQTGRAQRWLRVLADQGQLTVTDTGYRLEDLKGRILDEQEPQSGGPPGWADLVALQWKDLLARPGSSITAPVLDAHAAALACCQAALLSCRTGQAVCPRELLALR